MTKVLQPEYSLRKSTADDCSLEQIENSIRSSIVNSYLLDTTNISEIMGSPAVDTHHFPKFDMFRPLRQWLDNLTISTPELARKLCQSIPSQCPFERDIKFFGRTVLHIPPLCKLNPLYEELVMLRFRAMCYLADECGEDVSRYC